MTNTLRPSDMIAAMAFINAAEHATGTVTSGWVDMADFTAAFVVLAVGVMGADGTVDAKIEQAQDAAGTGVKDLSGTDITQIVKATGDNTQALIQFFADHLDLVNGFTHARVSVTVGTAATNLSATVLGCTPRYGPASTETAATVLQIVAA